MHTHTHTHTQTHPHTPPTATEQRTTPATITPKPPAHTPNTQCAQPPQIPPAHRATTKTADKFTGEHLCQSVI